MNLFGLFSSEEKKAVKEIKSLRKKIQQIENLGEGAIELKKEELKKYLGEAVEISEDKPILLDSYLKDAIELDVDVISDGKDIKIGGVLQHIEQAGIHSGDSACSLPPYSLDKKIINEIKKIKKNINQSIKTTTKKETMLIELY